MKFTFDSHFTGIEYTLFSCYFPPLKMWKKEKAMFVFEIQPLVVTNIADMPYPCIASVYIRHTSQMSQTSGRVRNNETTRRHTNNSLQLLLLSRNNIKYSRLYFVRYAIFYGCNIVLQFRCSVLRDVTCNSNSLRESVQQCHTMFVLDKLSYECYYDVSCFLSFTVQKCLT